jgi:hypothetical protein
MIAPLNERGLLTDAPFDEPIDYTFFNIWHHWGRTAKFGAWMQGPDYTQWHGAYEVMHDLSEFREQVDDKLSEVGLCLDMPEGFPSNESASTFIAQFEDVSQASISVTENCGETSIANTDEAPDTEIEDVEDEASSDTDTTESTDDSSEETSENSDSNEEG